MRTIKLMTDYECYPLWEASPGKIGDINPSLLPISVLLQKQLLDWADVYDRTLNWADPARSGFANVEAKNVFEVEGMRLADQLREELGSQFEVQVNVRAFVKAREV